jgi:hypothetical protein
MNSAASASSRFASSAPRARPPRLCAGVFPRTSLRGYRALPRRLLPSISRLSWAASRLLTLRKRLAETKDLQPGCGSARSCRPPRPSGGRQPGVGAPDLLGAAPQRPMPQRRPVAKCGKRDTGLAPGNRLIPPKRSRRTGYLTSHSDLRATQTRTGTGSSSVKTTNGPFSRLLRGDGLRSTYRRAQKIHP